MKKMFITIFVVFAFYLSGCDYFKALFYINHMETDSRIKRLNVGKIVDMLNIQPGWKIADIGAGSGLFSKGMALKALPDGIVYAIDINRDLLYHIEKTAAESGIKNIITVLAGESDPAVPRKVDLIFMCDTLHYIEDQKLYVKTLGTCLEKGGMIAIIDFRTNWPPLSNKFSVDDLKTWMKESGLELISSFDFIEDEFFMIFVKK